MHRGRESRLLEKVPAELSSEPKVGLISLPWIVYYCSSRLHQKFNFPNLESWTFGAKWIKKLSVVNNLWKFYFLSLGAVVIMFFICWAPFHAQRLLYVYAQEADYYPDLNEWLYILSGCLYYFSTTVNPILYNLMSARYRKAFRKIVFRWRPRKPPLPRSKEPKLNVKNPDLCRCVSNFDTMTFTIKVNVIPIRFSLRVNQLKTTRWRTNISFVSIRLRLNRTNEIFKLRPALQVPQRVAKNSIDSAQEHETEDDSRLDKPLIHSKHSNVGEQSSFESCSSQKKKLKESLSTASSSL